MTRGTSGSSAGCVRKVMNGTTARALLRCHAQYGVPFRESVLFVLRVSGHTLEEVCAELGRSRAGVHKALDGHFDAKADLRTAFRERIGVDPWSWASRQAPARRARRGAL